MADIGLTIKQAGREVRSVRAFVSFLYNPARIANDITTLLSGKPAEV